MAGRPYRRLIIEPMRVSRQPRGADLHAHERWLNALALAVAAGGALVLAVAAVIFPAGEAWGFDFHAYYQAALRLLATGSPYDPATLRGPFDLGPVHGLFVYSPLAAQVFVPLTALAEPAATAVWFALRVGLLGVTCALVPAAWRIRLALFGAGAMAMPVLSDLALGNVSLAITFLAVVAWRFMDRPLGGLAIAASLFLRPTLGLFLVWWLVRRRWAAALATIAAVVGLVVLSMLLSGPRSYLEYLAVLRNIGQVTGVPNNLDLASTAAHLGAPPEVAGLALAGSVALALGASLASLRRDREVSFVVVAMAVLFASPLLWAHYLTQLLLPAALLAARGRWWGLGLPLLAWAPPLVLPVVGIAGMLAPFLAPARGESALSTAERRSATVDRQPGAA
jgi:hypothetical protein